MDLAARVKEGVAAEDMVGFRFNTIGVSGAFYTKVFHPSPGFNT
jgi:hypothetical protein